VAQSSALAPRPRAQNVPKHFVHPPGGRPVGLGEQVGVDVQRRPHVGMAKAGGHRFDVLVHGEEQTRVAVPQVMKPERSELSPSGRPLERPLRPTLVEGSPVRAAEHEVMILPPRPDGHSPFYLVPTKCREGVKKNPRCCYAPDRVRSLRVVEVSFVVAATDHYNP